MASETKTAKCPTGHPTCQCAQVQAASSNTISDRDKAAREYMHNEYGPNERAVHVYYSDALMIFEAGWSARDKEIKWYDSELDEQCRINGMGAQRELKLESENKRLRAALEEFRSYVGQEIYDAVTDEILKETNG